MPHISKSLPAQAGITRCPWVPVGDSLYEKYHDREWGVPVYNDRKIFEFLVLESAQAGLSWRTILGRRAGYKKAFKNFDFNKVAKMGTNDVTRLMNDTGIIRNRLKIEAAINNAKRFIEVRKEFGTFSKYMWSWVGNKPIVYRPWKLKEYRVTTRESDAWSKDMKKRGFKFLGSTTLYAHMQAVGMVDDHAIGCWRAKRASK